MSKLIFAVIGLLCISSISYSQKRKLTPGEFAVAKGLELRSVKYKKNEAKIYEKIQKIKDHLDAQDSLTSVDYGRAYNYLATLYSYLETEPDSVSHYSKKAFEKHPEWFCKEVIPWQEKSESPEIKDQIMPYYLGSQELKLYKLMRKFCIQEEWLVAAEEEVENEEYMEALKAIEVNATVEKKPFEPVNWELQNQRDEENRIQLDALYNAFGFPSRKSVTHEGLTIAFNVLQQSSDCEWNKKWIPRFMERLKEFDSPGLVASMLERNFDKEDGRCKDQKEFVVKLVEAMQPQLVDDFNMTAFLD